MIYIYTYIHIPIYICIHTYTYIYVHTHIFHVVYVPYVLSQAHACVCRFIIWYAFSYTIKHTHTTLQFGFPSAPTSSYAYAAYAYTHPQRITAHPEENTRHSLTHISSKTKTVYSDWFNSKVLAKSYDVECCVSKPCERFLFGVRESKIWFCESFVTVRY